MSDKTWIWEVLIGVMPKGWQVENAARPNAIRAWEDGPGDRGYCLLHFNTPAVQRIGGAPAVRGAAVGRILAGGNVSRLFYEEDSPLLTDAESVAEWALAAAERCDEAAAEDRGRR